MHIIALSNITKRKNLNCMLFGYMKLGGIVTYLLIHLDLFSSASACTRSYIINHNPYYNNFINIILYYYYHLSYDHNILLLFIFEAMINR